MPTYVDTTKVVSSLDELNSLTDRYINCDFVINQTSPDKNVIVEINKPNMKNCRVSYISQKQGLVDVSEGGTGMTSSGAEGNVLMSDGSKWIQQQTTVAPKNIVRRDADGDIVSDLSAGPNQTIKLKQQYQELQHFNPIGFRNESESFSFTCENDNTTVLLVANGPDVFGVSDVSFDGYPVSLTDKYEYILVYEVNNVSAGQHQVGFQSESPGTYKMFIMQLPNIYHVLDLYTIYADQQTNSFPTLVNYDMSQFGLVFYKQSEGQVFPQFPEQDLITYIPGDMNITLQRMQTEGEQSQSTAFVFNQEIAQRAVILMFQTNRIIKYNKSVLLEGTVDGKVNINGDLNVTSINALNDIQTTYLNTTTARIIDVTLVNPLSLTQGGTGKTTAQDSINALTQPSSTNVGKVLMSVDQNGTYNTQFQTVPIDVPQGGTGMTSSGVEGNVLMSDGSKWIQQSTDVGSKNIVRRDIDGDIVGDITTKQKDQILKFKQIQRTFDVLQHNQSAVHDQTFSFTSDNDNVGVIVVVLCPYGTQLTSPLCSGSQMMLAAQSETMQLYILYDIAPGKGTHTITLDNPNGYKVLFSQFDNFCSFYRFIVQKTNKESNILLGQDLQQNETQFVILTYPTVEGSSIAILPGQNDLFKYQNGQQTLTFQQTNMSGNFVFDKQIPTGQTYISFIGVQSYYYKKVSIIEGTTAGDVSIKNKLLTNTITSTGAITAPSVVTTNISLTNPLSLAQGGTGKTTAQDSINVLTQPSSTNVGKVLVCTNDSGVYNTKYQTGPIGIAQGGTGQITSQAALDTLTQPSLSNVGKVMTCINNNGTYNTQYQTGPIGVVQGGTGQTTTQGIINSITQPSSTNVGKILTCVNDAGVYNTKYQTGPIDVTQGGTGQTTLQAALDALTQPSSSNVGQLLTCVNTSGVYNTKFQQPVFFQACTPSGGVELKTNVAGQQSTTLSCQVTVPGMYLVNYSCVLQINTKTIDTDYRYSMYVQQGSTKITQGESMIYVNNKSQLQYFCGTGSGSMILNITEPTTMTVYVERNLYLVSQYDPIALWVTKSSMTCVKIV